MRADTTHTILEKTISRQTSSRLEQGTLIDLIVTRSVLIRDVVEVGLAHPDVRHLCLIESFRFE